MINAENVYTDLSRLEIASSGRLPQTNTAMSRLEMAQARLERSNQSLERSLSNQDGDHFIELIRWLFEQTRYSNISAGIDQTGAKAPFTCDELFNPSELELHLAFDENGAVKIGSEHGTICLLAVKQHYLSLVNFYYDHDAGNKLLVETVQATEQALVMANCSPVLYHSDGPNFIGIINTGFVPSDPVKTVDEKNNSFLETLIANADSSNKLPLLPKLFGVTPLMIVVPLSQAMEVFNNRQKHRAVGGNVEMVLSNKQARNEIIDIWRKIALYETEVKKIRYLLHHVLEGYNKIGEDGMESQDIEDFFQMYVKRYLISLSFPGQQWSEITLGDFVLFIEKNETTANDILDEIARNNASENPKDEISREQLARFSGNVEIQQPRLFDSHTFSTSNETTDPVLSNKASIIAERCDDDIQDRLEARINNLAAAEEKEIDLPDLPVSTKHRQKLDQIRQMWQSVSTSMNLLRNGENQFDNIELTKVVQFFSNFIESTKIDHKFIKELVDGVQDKDFRDLLQKRTSDNFEFFDLHTFLKKILDKESNEIGENDFMYIEMLFYLVNSWVELYTSRHDNLTGLPMLEEFLLKFNKKIREVVKSEQQADETQKYKGKAILHFIDLGYIGYFSDLANRETGALAIVKAICQVEDMLEHEFGADWRDFFVISRYAGDEIAIEFYPEGSGREEFSLTAAIHKLNIEGEKIEAVGVPFSDFFAEQIEYNDGQCSLSEAKIDLDNLLRDGTYDAETAGRLGYVMTSKGYRLYAEAINEGYVGPEPLLDEVAFANELTSLMLRVADAHSKQKKSFQRFQKLWKMWSKLISSQTRYEEELRHLTNLFVYSIKAMGGRITSVYSLVVCGTTLERTFSNVGNDNVSEKLLKAFETVIDTMRLRRFGSYEVQSQPTLDVSQEFSNLDATLSR